MPISVGFPSSNIISPSVRITEIDLSYVEPSTTFHNAGIIGFASKGPINIPTLITSVAGLNTKFGYPHPAFSDPYLVYAAQQFLAISNGIYIVRVADISPVSDESATTASYAVPAAGGLISIISHNPEPYVVVNDSYFRWKLNGILASKTLVVPGSGSSHTAASLANYLNSYLSDDDGIQFVVHNDGVNNYIAVQTLWAYGPESTLELLSVHNSLYGNTWETSSLTSSMIEQPLGFGTGMTPATLTGTLDHGPSDSIVGEWTFDEDVILDVVVAGTDNASIDNVVQTVVIPAMTSGGSATPITYYTGTVPPGEVGLSETINDVIETDLPGGWMARKSGNFVKLVTMHSGRDAKLLVRSSGNGATLLGLATTTNTGVSPVGTSGQASPVDQSALGVVSGGNAPSDAISFTIYADSPGVEGNSTEVLVSQNIRDNTFNLAIYNNGYQVENWGRLTKDITSNYYVKDYVNQVSSYIRVEDAAGNYPPMPTVTGYQLTGGSDGIPSDSEVQDTLLIGSPLDFSGIYSVSEPEQLNLDFVAVPGHSSTDIVVALKDLCENYRQDCIAIIDPPFGMDVNEIIQWQNGTHPLNQVKLDSDFLALYWPWVKVYDTFNKLYMWLPPSGSVLAAFANSDNIGQPWEPAAGETRGVVPNIVDVYSRPTLAQRDAMYAGENCINPIIQFSDNENYLIWGNKTMQRRSTALNRIGVRRLMFVIEKRIRSASRALLFEPHDTIFTNRFIQICKTILDDITINRGIGAYIIKADDELNTPEVIDRNEFRARISIQPLHAVEYIFLEFTINRTGAFTQG